MEAPVQERQGIAGSPLTYSPPPNESPYYESLFVTADHTNSGNLGGREAVNFLSRSKLPLDLLKNIWSMADNPKTNSLDRNKFFVAVRLIQLFQNGEKAQDSSLGATNNSMRPPFFEGVTDVSIQPFGISASLQPSTAAPAYPIEQQQKQQPPAVSPARPPMHPNSSVLPQITSTLAVQDPYIMQPGEQSRYETLFPQYMSKEDGFVHGKEAVGLFSKSGLDKGTLRDIWNMVDDPIDNRLSKLEFAMAMHLIVCISKKGLPVPPSLPMSLKSLTNAGKGGASVPPMSGATATAPPPLTTQTQQQQFINPAMSHDTASSQPQQNTSQTPAGYPSNVRRFSGMGQVGGGDSVMGLGSITSGGGLSVSDAFNDLNPEEVAKAGESYYLNTSQDTYSSVQPPAEVTQPPFPSTNGVSVAPQPDQNNNLHSYQSAVGGSFNADPMSTSAAPWPVEENKTVPTIDKPIAATIKFQDDDNNDAKELVKMQAVLQKIQAENISLKAQMGQYTAEELQVRSDITRTIEDIGVSSQEVATLRVQVSNAKAALIEATTELKFKNERKLETQDLISDLEVAKDALNTAVDTVKESNASTPLNQESSDAIAPLNQQSSNAVAASTNAFEANLFDFDAPAPAPVANHSTDLDLMGGTIGSLNQNNPLVHGIEGVNNQSSVLLDDTQSLPGIMSSRTVEDVDELKVQAQNAENAAKTAEDHTRSLTIQLDNIQVAVEEAEKIANEKHAAIQGKKKGFGRGNKKAMRDAEAAVKEASEAKKQFEETKSEMSAAEAEVKALHQKANKLRDHAEQAEIEFVQGESMMTNATAPVPATSYDFSYMSTTSLPTIASNGYKNPINGQTSTEVSSVGFGGGGMGGTTQGVGIDKTMNKNMNEHPSNANGVPAPDISVQESDYSNPFF